MGFKKLFRKDDKAVSPVIGVILMVAITVILAAAIGSSVFGKGTTESAPQANFDIKATSVTDNNTEIPAVKIEHLGGDPIHFEKDSVTKVMASVNDEEANQIKSDGTDILGTIGVGDIKTLKLYLDEDGTTVLKHKDGSAVGEGDTVNIKFIDSQTNQIICDKDVRF